MVQEGTLYAASGQVNTNPAINPEIYIGDLPAGYAGIILAQKSWEQPTALRLELRFTP